MKFYIELTILASLFFMFLAWLIYLWVSKLWFERRYKTENDKGYQGEQRRKQLIAEGQQDPVERITGAIGGNSESAATVGEPVNADEGQGEPEGRDELQAADADADGKTGSSTGKTKRKPRNPFRKR